MQTNVTNDLLRRGQSGAGGWNRQQLRLIGIEHWPPPHGWQKRILGHPIAAEDVERFIALRGVTKRIKKRYGVVIETRTGDPLPLPREIRPAVARAFSSFWIYVQRLDPQALKDGLPALQYMVRTASQRVE
ncbi:hypothetical protein [Luteolibacter sp. Populi]|uniref:hypothetical protein n=1 Tax=Luteolibacter sp. Populi TaxID=3230487 RepID=UPI003467CE7E